MGNSNNVPCINNPPNESDTKNPGEPVFVNVYHLHWPNGMKMGAYHSGSVVYDREYGFGGHPFEYSGIFESDPNDIDELGTGVSLKETIYMGQTYLSELSIARLLESMADEYRGTSYHLLNYNCNHFTAHLVKLLCNGDLPKWINKLARIASSVPFIESTLPAHWVRPSLLPYEDGDDDSSAAFENNSPYPFNSAPLIGASSSSSNHRSCNGTTGTSRRSKTPINDPGTLEERALDFMYSHCSGSTGSTQSPSDTHVTANGSSVQRVSVETSTDPRRMRLHLISGSGSHERSNGDAGRRPSASKL